MGEGVGHGAAEEDNLPADVDPGQDDREDGEGAIHRAGARDAHLRHGAEPKPAAKDKGRDESGNYGVAEGNVAVRHEGEEEGEAKRGEYEGDRPAKDRGVDDGEGNAREESGGANGGEGRGDCAAEEVEERERGRDERKGWQDERHHRVDGDAPQEWPRPRDLPDFV